MLFGEKLPTCPPHFRFYTLSTTTSHHTLQILHTTPCTLHPPVATLRISDCKLDIPHFNLPTPPLSAFYALHSTQLPTLDTTTLHTAVPCRLHTALYTLHIIRFALHRPLTRQSTQTQQVPFSLHCKLYPFTPYTFNTYFTL